jgi:hypothetical protein
MVLDFFFIVNLLSFLFLEVIFVENEVIGTPVSFGTNESNILVCSR